MKQLNTLLLAIAGLLAASGAWQNTAAQSTPAKKVLVEHFTNTYCPNCINRNPGFYANVVDPHEDTDVLHISYHPQYPSPNDVFYQANPAEAMERWNYYGVSGTPSGVVEGVLQPFSTAIVEPGVVNNAIANAAASVGIAVSETLDGDQRTVNVQITGSGNSPSGMLQLRVAVVEKVVETIPPPFAGGEETHRNVFRRTLNGWQGETFTAPTGSNPLNYTYSYGLESGWNGGQIYVLAFVQNDVDKSVLNAASSWQNQMVTGTGSLPQQPDGLRLYPNPVVETLVIELPPAAGSRHMSLGVYSTAGKLLLQQDIAAPGNRGRVEVPATTLPPGVYIARLADAEGRLWQQKFVKR